MEYRRIDQFHIQNLVINFGATILYPVLLESSSGNRFLELLSGYGPRAFTTVPAPCTMQTVFAAMFVCNFLIVNATGRLNAIG
jgi:hypothetical protein